MGYQAMMSCGQRRAIADNCRKYPNIGIPEGRSDLGVLAGVEVHPARESLGMLGFRGVEALL